MISKETRFWRNVGLIGIAHVVLLVGLIRWSREPKSIGTQNVVWMSGGAGDGAATETKNAPAPKPARMTLRWTRLGGAKAALTHRLG